MARTSYINFTGGVDSVWAPTGKRIPLTHQGRVFFDARTPPDLEVHGGNGDWQPVKPGGTVLFGDAPHSASRPEFFARMNTYVNDGLVDRDFDYPLIVNTLGSTDRTISQNATHFRNHYRCLCSDEPFITTGPEIAAHPHEFNVPVLPTNETAGVCLGDLYHSGALQSAQCLVAEVKTYPGLDAMPLGANSDFLELGVFPPVAAGVADLCEKGEFSRDLGNFAQFDTYPSTLRTVGRFVFPGPFSVFDSLMFRGNPVGITDYVAVRLSNYPEKHYAEFYLTRNTIFTNETNSYILGAKWPRNQMVNYHVRVVRTGGDLYVGHGSNSANVASDHPFLSQFNASTDVSNNPGLWGNNCGTDRRVVFQFDNFSGTLTTASVVLWEL